MQRTHFHSIRCFVFTLGVLGLGEVAFGQPAPTTPAAGPASTATAAGRAVVIERAPVIFRDPLKYQVNLHLEPVKKLILTSTVDGVVTTVMVKVGADVVPQAEVIRLDARDTQLQLKRAQAAIKAAKADLEGTMNKPAAEARVLIAETDLEIAELNQSRTVIRSPLKGIMTAIHVVDGSYVRAGQPLAEVIDPSQFFVEVPIDGKTQKAGSTIELKIEDQNVPASLAVVLPLTPQFDQLRDLFLSPATGRVLLDNPGGKWRAGQTVHSAMIPRLPVAEVPTAAIVNADQGGRKVQIIREGFVRDIPVQLLGQMGADQVFVSGRFGGTDELVLKSSEPLLDGARVMAREAKPATPAGTTPKPAQPGTGSGF